MERGTFSHRHLIITDQKTGGKHCAIDSAEMGQKPGMFSVCNSSLSEFGVLGYELGYSLENPNSLVLWEAQFGDFSNGAQIIFDQFMSCGESKWLRQVRASVRHATSRSDGCTSLSCIAEALCVLEIVLCSAPEFEHVWCNESGSTAVST